jgi:hypothetical protein
MGHPICVSENWDDFLMKRGFEGKKKEPHFSQKTREMGHPIFVSENWDDFLMKRGFEGKKERAPLLAKDARNGAPHLCF